MSEAFPLRAPATLLCARIHQDDDLKVPKHPNRLIGWSSISICKWLSYAIANGVYCILQLSPAMSGRWATKDIRLCLGSGGHPHHLGHPQTHHLGRPAEFAHAPHFDTSLRPPPNASLEAPMMILLTASTESDWSACCRGGKGSFYPCLNNLAQPFRVWLGGGEKCIKSWSWEYFTFHIIAV